MSPEVDRHQRKILLVRPDHLGDLILSLPVAEALKFSFPDCRVFYLASNGPASMRTMVDYVDGWIINERQGSGRVSTWELARVMRSVQFGYVIDLKPSWRTSIAAFLARVPNRIGTSRRFYSFLYNRRVNLHRKGSGRHQTDLDLELLKPMGVEVSGALPSLKLNADCLEKASELLGGDLRPYVVLHPGSGGSTPKWPVDSYRALSKMLLRDGTFNVVITGNDDNIGSFEGCLDLNGKTDLEALAGVLSRAALFVSVGTGPLHLADTLGTKCVALFTSRPGIEPERWGPRRNLGNVLVPDNGPCRCEDISRCRCLEQITPEKVFKKIKEVVVLDNDRAVSKA